MGVEFRLICPCTERQHLTIVVSNLDVFVKKKIIIFVKWQVAVLNSTYWILFPFIAPWVHP